MGALAVVEAFDVIEDLSLRLGPVVELSPVDQVEFERAPEAFDESVVVTVAFAAHGGDEAGLLEGGAVIAGGVLNAPIGVAEQTCGRMAMEQGHCQSL